MPAPTQPPLIVTTATAGYGHWLRHLKANLRLFNLDKLLRVCAADSATMRLAASIGILTVLPQQSNHSLSAAQFNLPTSETPGTFMSASWKAAVHYKQHCVWTLLERLSPGAHLLLTDADVTFFQNPLPELLPAPGLNATMIDDVTLLDDTTPRSPDRYLNSGFMLLRNTPATRQFGRAFVTQLSRRRDDNDQAVFNDVLRQMSTTGPLARMPHTSGGGRQLAAAFSSKQGTHATAAGKAAAKGGVKTSGAKAVSARTAARHGGGLRVRALDTRRFSNGFLFYEYRHKRKLNASALVAVHHNWIRGDRNKWERAVAYDTVVEEDTETARHFLKRARSSMTNMRAWQYRNRAHPGNRPSDR